jgi:hypothetical protein
VLIAADTNVLLDRAEGFDIVSDCLDILRERLKVDRVLVTPTVLLELSIQADFGSTKEKRDWAFSALAQMRSWGFEGSKK